MRKRFVNKVLMRTQTWSWSGSSFFPIKILIQEIRSNWICYMCSVGTRFWMARIRLMRRRRRNSQLFNAKSNMAIIMIQYTSQAVSSKSFSSFFIGLFFRYRYVNILIAIQELRFWSSTLPWLWWIQIWTVCSRWYKGIIMDLYEAIKGYLKNGRIILDTAFMPGG